MSVRKSLTAVTLMPHVPTFLGASPVPVIKDTVEMESIVLVCEIQICTVKYLTSILIDINECVTGANDCDSNATCTNTPGNFNCSCNEGYSGDGTFCFGKINTRIMYNILTVSERASKVASYSSSFQRI